MKKIVFMLFAFAVILPNVIKAEEVDNDELVLMSETTKYYKTITFNDDFCAISNSCDNSVTYEVTKEEYDNYKEPENRQATIETTYKRLTSTIYQNLNLYRYKATLTWKNMPSKRSYDIMGIGFYQSVKVSNNTVFFYQRYTPTGGSNITTSVCYPQVFAGGAGASFPLPSGSLSALSQELYFDVEKNTTATIIEQLAAADYAHATKTISLANSKKYTVGPTGITLNGVSSYYDAMNSADDYWHGTW